MTYSGVIKVRSRKGTIAMLESYSAGLKDGDLSRTAMEIIYLVLAIRGIIVWF